MWENDRSRRKMEERKRQIQKRITVSAILTAVVLVLFFVFFFHRNTGTKKMTYQKAGMDAWEQYDIGDPVKQVPQPELDVQLLTVNEYSRPGIATDGVRGVVVHYTAIQEVPHRIIGIILKASRTPEKIRSAAILSSDWTERSFSAFRQMRSPMHLTTATTIQCPLNVVIRMSQERSRR